MSSMIPVRLEIVNASSAYSFITKLSRFYPDGFKREQVVVDEDFFGKFNEKSRSDFIRAHLDYCVDSKITRAVNSHFEFTENDNLKFFFALIKDGKPNEAKSFFGKFLMENDLFNMFFQFFKGKMSLTGNEAKSFLDANLPNQKSLKRVRRFFVKLMFKAGLIADYNVKEQIIVLHKKEGAGKVEEKPEVTKVESVHFMAATDDKIKRIKGYMVTVSSPQGDIKEYSLSFEKMLKIAGILENDKGARQEESG